jgi:hypothetical protein
MESRQIMNCSCNWMNHCLKEWIAAIEDNKNMGIWMEVHVVWDERWELRSAMWRTFEPCRARIQSRGGTRQQFRSPAFGYAYYMQK